MQNDSDNSRHRAFQIFAVFVFPVVLFLVSLWLSGAFTSSRTRVVVEVRQNRECVNVDAAIRSDVSILYGGEEVAALFLLTLRFANTGDRDIVYSNDVLSPISVSFPDSQDLEIRGVISQEGYPSETMVSHSLLAERTRLGIEFNVLRARGYLEISALYTAKDVGKPGIAGVIRDAELVLTGPQPFEDTPAQTVRDSVSSVATVYALFAYFCVIWSIPDLRAWMSSGILRIGRRLRKHILAFLTGLALFAVGMGVYETWHLMCLVNLSFYSRIATIFVLSVTGLVFLGRALIVVDSLWQWGDTDDSQEGTKRST